MRRLAVLFVPVVVASCGGSSSSDLFSTPAAAGGSSSGGSSAGASNGGASAGTDAAGGSGAGGQVNGGSGATAGAGTGGTSSGGAGANAGTGAGGKGKGGHGQGAGGAKGGTSAQGGAAAGGSGRAGAGGSTAGAGGASTGGADAAGGAGAGTAGSGPPPPFCGDGIKNGAEDCDGTDLGGADCASVIPGTTGTLACTADCHFDASNCMKAKSGALVTCGAKGSQVPECDTKSQECCLSSVNHDEPGMCLDQNQPCDDGTSTGGTIVLCDGPSTCAVQGKVCCGHRVTVHLGDGQPKVFYQVLECQSSCDANNDEITLCDPQSPNPTQCPPLAPFCQQSQLLPPGYFVCKS